MSTASTPINTLQPPTTLKFGRQHICFFAHTLRIYDVIGVDEEEQTITLSLKAIVEWQDNRLDVNRSKEYIERYRLLQKKLYFAQNKYY